MTCWIRLGIEPTKDQNAIRGAYRTRLPAHHPETDPEGFQALREAYESALRHARETDEPAIGHNEDRQAAEPPTLIAFHELLGDSRRRFEPRAWEDFVRQLDLLPLEALEDISWQLLETLRACAMVSNECARILARRLAWSQQLLRLDVQVARQIEEFLNRIEQPDPFPTTLMGEWPALAQQETLWYLLTLEHLYTQRPLYEYQAFASIHTCLPLPADANLLQRLLVQFIHAGVPGPSLYALCAEQQSADPDNVDLLHLLALYSSTLGLDEVALSWWTLLWWKHQHPQAPRHLLDLCAKQKPEYLPLLILALNHEQPTREWPTQLGDPSQLYGSSSQTPETLSRWLAASGTTLPPLAAAFVAWQIHNNDPLPLLALLLDEHPQPALQQLYRHAWALQRGDRSLLQQIAELPPHTDLFEELLHKGFREQAQQQLHWLDDAPVPKALHNLLLDNGVGFPSDLGEGYAPQACNKWLLRMRAYDRHALEHILQRFDLQQMHPRPWALQHQARLARAGLEFSARPSEEDPWRWHSQSLFTLALLEQPERWLSLLTPSILRNLELEPGYIAQTRDLLGQWLDANATIGDLLAQLDYDNPVQDLLSQELCDATSALNRPRLPVCPLLYRNLVNDRETFAGDTYSMLLFWGALLRSPDLNNEDRHYLHEHIASVSGSDPELEAFRELVLKNGMTRSVRKQLKARKAGGDPLYVALETLITLSGENGTLPGSKQLLMLQQAKDDSHNGTGLRLALTTLLSLVERLMGMRNGGMPAKPWMLWEIESRLGRSGFAMMLVFWSISSAGVKYLPSYLFGLGLSLTISGFAATCLRRLRDLGLGYPTFATLIILSIAAPATIPFQLLIMLLAPSSVLPNSYGLPASKKFRKLLEAGLQAALRHLQA